MTDPEPDEQRVVRLREPRHRVERSAILWWTLRVLGGLVPLLAALLVAHTLVESARPWLGPILVVVAVVGAVLVLVMPTWRYRVHRWETSDEAVYSLSGWFVREWRVVPISRIQTVDTVRGPLQQALGLSTLAVTTASSRGTINIVGLNDKIATDVAEQLVEITQATPGDAT